MDESKEKYRYLVESSPDAIAVIQDNRHQLINSEFTRLFGYTQSDLDDHVDFFMTIKSQDRKMVRERINKRLDGKEVYPKKWCGDFVTKDNKLIPCETSGNVIQYNGRPATLVIIRDITERRRSEIALQESRELLKVKAQDLEEVNTALKVLLKQRAQDKFELEKKVLFNVEQRILPLLQQIKNGSLDFRQKSLIDILESNINEIVSSFSIRLYTRPGKLTPAEIQVCNLIKRGKTSLEIAGLLYVSEKTIAAHRRNIRKKLGIKNKKENLRTYLLALETD